MMIHLAHWQLGSHGLSNMLAIPNTALLEMTFSHWKNLGLETEKKINIFSNTEHSLNVNHRIHADASYVESCKGAT